MIGQEHLKSVFKQQIENNTLPRFIILVGQKGSGKKLFAREITRHLSVVEPYRVSTAVADVRKMVEASYQIPEPIVYLIADADNMSEQAKNAMLKVTEEPPNKAYFILTLTDENNTLKTILSRSFVYRMDKYTPEQIKTYYTAGNREERGIVCDLCETPGEVDLLVKMGVLDFYKYVELVVDNIAETTTANSFKIGDKLALKTDAEGYDLELFLKAFMRVCTDRAKVEQDSEKKFKYLKAAQATGKYLREVHIKSINNQMLLDNWIIDIRREWA